MNYLNKSTTSYNEKINDYNKSQNQHLTSIFIKNDY